MKNQTRLRRVVLAVVNAGWIFWNDNLKSWVLILQGKSSKRVNFSEKYSMIAPTNIVFKRSEHNTFSCTKTNDKPFSIMFICAQNKENIIH